MSKSTFFWVLSLLLAGASVFIATDLTAEDQEVAQAAQGKGAAKKVVTAYVPRTGQTISYAPGDDGDLQRGFPWPEPRFTDNSDGTVTDKLTGLMWTKNAHPISAMAWEAALQACNDFVFAGYDDWRMPNVREMSSLIRYGGYGLPDGHPFDNIYNSWKWTSTGGGEAYACDYEGQIRYFPKTYDFFDVCPVRGGKY
jgi:hypothetical protein